MTPAVGTEGTAAADDSELRKGYGIGLDLLRETALRAGARRPVDMRQTTEVVDRLTTTILRDPAQALLLTTVKSYDEYTYYHMVNVCLLTIALGHAVGLRRDQIVALGIGALLHDVGKMNVPGEVLNHVGPLTQDQWRVVQRHPVDGAGLVFGTSEGLYHPAATVVLEHHAGFDLTGYPRLSRRPLPSLPARLVAVADCFDAVTSNRAYRRAEERRQALNILVAGSGRGLDPRIVRAFVRLLGLFPLGSLVRLSTGEVCVVVRRGTTLARPVVRTVLDAHGDVAEPEEYDLGATASDDTHLRSIAGSVDPAELGIDMTVLLADGSLETLDPDGAGGLVHEPSFGEAQPSGYVDTHSEVHEDHAIGDGMAVDPDVAPPFEP